MNWDHIVEQINQVEVIDGKANELVTVKWIPKSLECIGVGTDAAVFRSINLPNHVFKVFSPDRMGKVEIEECVYKRLKQSEFYPVFYGSGPNFLVLSFEKGLTLYDCLLKGIHIPEQVILDVEEARKYARSKGLNPRDIHLKNVILQTGRAKVMDVSEYLEKGNDFRWEYLKQAYYEYYPLIDRKEVPYWMIETVRIWYNQSSQGSFQFQDFIKKIIKLFRLESH